jgi:N-glycosylase/DNA lyase
MKIVTARLQGVRVVRQDPWECLISFICSSNNNIARITQMLDKLRRKYGHKLCTVTLVKVTSDNTVDKNSILPIDVSESMLSSEHSAAPSSYAWVVQYPTADATITTENADSPSVLESYELYSFPTVTALAEASEGDLRALGMGYRAKFIVNSAKLVQAKCAAMREVGVKREYAEEGRDEDRGEEWFEYLRSLAAKAAQHHETDNHEAIGDQTLRKIKQEPGYKGSAVDDVGKSHAAGTPSMSRDEARLQVQQLLMELPGVGRKVADCVALFSLDQTAAVPVDTHVWNIAIRDYAPHLRRSAVPPVVKDEPGTQQVMSVKIEFTPGTPNSEGATPAKSRGKRKLAQATPFIIVKQEADASPAPSSALEQATPSTPSVESIETMSLTPAVYEMVGQVFRDHFGQYAGWAHSVLFAAELPQFRVLLPESLQKEMTDFSALQRSAKKEKRDEKAKKSAAGGEVALADDFEDENITYSPVPKKAAKVVRARKS